MPVAEAVMECVVVVHNIAKRHNVGTMARSATAFGVSEIVLVGRRDFNAFGSHGSTSHLRFRHFYSLSQAHLYLKDERDFDICGVEIAEGAMPVNNHPFRKSTAFLLGNEGSGLSAKECEICDFFCLHSAVWVWNCITGCYSCCFDCSTSFRRYLGIKKALFIV